jgi:hypothetical protein
VRQEKINTNSLATSFESAIEVQEGTHAWYVKVGNTLLSGPYHIYVYEGSSQKERLFIPELKVEAIKGSSAFAWAVYTDAYLEDDNQKGAHSPRILYYVNWERMPEGRKQARTSRLVVYPQIPEVNVFYVPHHYCKPVIRRYKHIVSILKTGVQFQPRPSTASIPWTSFSVYCRLAASSIELTWDPSLEGDPILEEYILQTGKVVEEVLREHSAWEVKNIETLVLKFDCLPRGIISVNKQDY